MRLLRSPQPGRAMVATAVIPFWYIGEPRATDGRPAGSDLPRSPGAHTTPLTSGEPRGALEQKNN
eukprot:10560584-Alexandrium_andersonii.AAC.1